MPQDPYKSYVIGALKPDDFGSFEVTFSADTGTEVPIQLSYKDDDGNVITSTQNVTVPLASAGSADSGFPVLPVIAVIIVVGIFLGGWSFYLRRYKE